MKKELKKIDINKLKIGDYILINYHDGFIYIRKIIDINSKYIFAKLIYTDDDYVVDIAKYLKKKSDFYYA